MCATSASPALDGAPRVLVPVGSTEQHGPHLPLDTDTVIAVAVTERVAARLGSEPMVAPPIQFGASGEHQGFPGTMSVGREVVRLTVIELVRSLSLWAGGVVFVNAHGGNAPSLSEAVRQLGDEQHDVGWVPCAVDGSDAHAGHTETSLMLYLASSSVGLSVAAAGNVTPVDELLDELRERGVRGVSANGVLGDPTQASAVEGERLLTKIVEDVRSRITCGRHDANGCLTLPADGSAARTEVRT